MARSRRTTRQGRASQPARDGNGVASVHRDMVREEVSHMSPPPERPLKRRKVAGNTQTFDTPPSKTDAEHKSESIAVADPPTGFDDSRDASSHDDQPKGSSQQTVFDDSESSSENEDEEEDEYDWEQILATSDKSSEPKQESTEEVSINLGGDTPSRRAVPRRLPGTAAQKRLRVAVHKCHFLTLLLHVYVRSYWCNDKHVQSSLRPLLSKRVVEFLTPDPALSQFDQSSRFIAGLEDAGKAWRGAFKVKGVGMRSGSWATSPSVLDSRSQAVAASEASVNHACFIRAAKDRSGSRDLGAQLFCALLRATGVDARLVCSLQPLPFASGPTTVAAQPSQKTTVDLSSSSTYASYSYHSEEADDVDETSGPPRLKRFGGRGSRDREPIDLGRAPEAPVPVRPCRNRDSPYPIFWVEAFNHARQAWISVDPLVTQTISKPAKLEPPANDSLNDMSYVIGFEEDGTARDVTKRYTKAYNAKTRKHRVDVDEDGRRWLRRAMKMFRGVPQDRDAIEDAEFLKREGQEPMPKNIQDFKDHPYYALERHLRRDEVIHPRREVGKLAVGKTADKVEPVFRRSHVIRLRSAEKWTRLGREIQPGAQPLKRVTRPRRPRRSLSDDESDQEYRDDMGLFALHQTDIYVPPPIVRGQVPKNKFGNIEVFVQTMIPPRAVHIRASDGILAARTLGIDFAQAVTGFKFKGRQGTAIVYGVIVARDYREAMEEVVSGLHYQQERIEAERRTANNIRMWKRFLTGLRIRARIMEEHGEAEEQEDNDMQDAIDDEEYKEEKSKEEGGFMLDKDQAAIAEPTASRVQSRPRVDNATLRGPQLPRNFYFEPTVTSPWDRPGALGGTLSGGADDVSSKGDAMPRHGVETDSGGRFIVTDDDHGGGGFIVDKVHTGGGNMAQKQDTTANMPAMEVPADTGGGFVFDGANKDEEAPTIESTADDLPAKQVTGETNIRSPDIEEPRQPDTIGHESHDVAQVDTSAMSEATNDEKDEEGGGDNDDDSDFGEGTSLPSHDPEDDDAEPEWLFYNTTL